MGLSEGIGVEEQDIIRMLSEDYSAGTDAFREELLERCLEVLGDEDHAVELDDQELEMLAAAGDPPAYQRRHEDKLEPDLF